MNEKIQGFEWTLFLLKLLNSFFIQLFITKVWLNFEWLLDPNERGKFPLLLVILILGSLAFVIILTVILFYVYTKRIKNRITKQIANHTRPESGGFDDYDDIGIPSDLGKEIYDTYDVVEEGDPRYGQSTRYSEPYYTAEPDSVQIPNQTRDDYWPIPSP